METGVDAGSMLVPELVWLSSVSIRVVGGLIMFMPMLMGVAGVFCGVGICVEDISIPGMSGMGGCWVCARRGSAVSKTSGSNVVACQWDMVIPSLEDCVVGRQRLENAVRRARQERTQIRRVMRGGGGGDAVRRVTGDKRKGRTSLFSEGVKTAIDGVGCLISAELTTAGCCCAAQQEGSVWLWGAGFGQ